MKIILFLFLTTVFFTQTNLEEERLEKSTLDNTLSILSSPLSWDSNDFETLGYISLGALSLYHFDEDITSFIKKQKSSFSDDVESVGDFYGKPNTAVMLTGSMYGLGYIFKDPWLKETSLMLGSTIAASGFFQFILTRTFGRSRPENNLGKSQFNLFSFEKKIIHFLLDILL